MRETMECNSCQHEINREVNFCENCGSTTTEVNDLDITITDENRGDKLIFAGLMLICGATFYYFLIELVIQITGSTSIYRINESISVFVSLIASGATLLIALGLKMSKRKLLALIFASVYTVIQLYWITSRMNF